MVRSLSLAAASMLFAGSVFAATAAPKVECSTADAAKFQPQAALIAKLKAEGT